MVHKHLAVYLNDHLAGSVTLLELLSHLSIAYGGTDIEDFAKDLRAEVLEDRKELEGLMEKLKVGQSISRKTGAWIAEKLAEFKLRIDDPAAGAQRLFEAMEAASIGIEGKRLLWVCLKTLAADVPELREWDFDRLRERAEQQRQRVESVRLAAAKEAIVPVS